MNFTRRQCLSAALALPLLITSKANARGAEALAAIERRSGGRLGVHLFDGETSLGHRADERFGLCSTFKLVLAAMVLHEADRGRLALDRELQISENDRVPHMPSTQAQVGGTMRVDALAEAAQKTSDNLAANLLLRELGGPAALTAFCRQFGDTETRIDRYEPEMNLVPAGEVRDTTTPRAMAGLLARLFSEDGLSAKAQAILRRWMIDTTTGARRLRAGLPQDWIVGDKTGTALSDGMNDKINDIAVVWRADRVLTIATYFEASAGNDNIRREDEAVLNSVGEWAARIAGLG